MSKIKRDKYGRVVVDPDAVSINKTVTPPPIPKRNKVPEATDDQYEAPTIMAASSMQRPTSVEIPTPAQQRTETTNNNEQKTRLYRPADQAIDDQYLDQSDFLPVGWLVIVSGPGLGKYLPIGYGWNKIGRDPVAGNRIVLDFGDVTISSSNHARINCNIEKNTFKIAHQDGINNTYVNGHDLDTTVDLEGGERIRIGETELIFVRLCGPSFSWG